LNVYYIECILHSLSHARSQEFAKKGQNKMEVPQRIPGAEPGWGSGGKALEAGDMLNIWLMKMKHVKKIHHNKS